MGQFVKDPHFDRAPGRHHTNVAQENLVAQYITARPKRPVSIACITNMSDPRYRKLATLLVQYSTALKKGDQVLLDLTDVPDDFTIELIRAAREAGAIPLTEVRHSRITRELLRDTNEEHAGLVRDVELFRMKKVQAYIAVRGSLNSSETSDVSSDLMGLYSPSHAPGVELSREQDALVRPALAHAQHGPKRRNEHRGL